MVTEAVSGQTSDALVYAIVGTPAILGPHVVFSTATRIKNKSLKLSLMKD